MARMMPASALRPILALLVALAALGGCSAAINPALREDAQLSARVKTALVNHPVLGVYPIQVRAAGGVVQLTGQVAAEAEIAQVVALVRAVPGVTDVQPLLRVAPADVPPEPGSPGNRPSSGARPLPPRYEEPIQRTPDFGWLAVGGSVRLSDPRSDRLERRVSVGPILRLGSGTGPGLSVGLGWTTADLHGPSSGGDPIARLQIRPLMLGAGYTVRHRRLSATLSAVAGVAFNSLTLPDRIEVTETALEVDHSLAWRPGLSLWLDANDRMALNLFTGYLVTRPRVALVEGGELVERTLRADSLIVSAGLAYKVF